MRDRSSTAEPVDRRIGICADDFGLHPAIDDGVLKLLAAGRLSAVSCLVDGPGWPEAAQALQEVPADVGLHLNFTEPFPGATPVSPLASMQARAYLGLLSSGEVRTSIERQLGRFEEAMGRAPDFVDGHQHVHQLPLVRETLLSILSMRYPSKPWIRSTAIRRHYTTWRRSGDHIKARIIALLGNRALLNEAGWLGFKTNGALLGVYGFDAVAGVYESCMAQWLGAACDGDLLMSHPASGFVPGDAIAAARRHEFDVLSGSAFERLLLEQRIEVARLSERLANSPTARMQDAAQRGR